ncbi:MAG: DUF1648 domain-containing protein [Ruminococcus sp.]|nr:DUF1648 domain-containing protein [Ruminococcus sp.]
MNRKIMWIHRVIFWINVLLLAASLVLYLTKWNELPDEIGVHFGPDGNFDVIASKLYGFYPHLIGGIVIAGIAAADHIILKKNTGLKISEKGERLFKSELILTLDVFTFFWSAFFSIWSHSVCLQKPLDTDLVRNITSVVSVLILIGIIIQICTCIRYRTEKKSSDNNLMHRLSRLIAWLLTFGGIGVIAECWSRYPTDERLYYDPEYYGLAYFANFDAYLDKRLLLIPHFVVIVLLAVLEIISVRAAGAGRNTLVSLTDKLKLICGGFFFWWNLVLETENSVGMISAGLFVLLCAVSFAVYKLKNKTLSKPEE